MLYRDYKEKKLKDIKMFILSEILITPKKLFDFLKFRTYFLYFSKQINKGSYQMYVLSC